MRMTCRWHADDMRVRFWARRISSAHHPHIIHMLSGSMHVVRRGQQLCIKPTGFLVKHFKDPFIEQLDEKFVTGSKQIKSSAIITVRNSCCGKVMISQACVKNSIHTGVGRCKPPPRHLLGRQPHRPPLHRTVRILPECILVLSLILHGTLTFPLSSNVIGHQDMHEWQINPIQFNVMHW